MSNESITQSYTTFEIVSGVSTVVVTQLDLFFQQKDSDLGVEVQIREMDRGLPTNRIVPFGRKFLPSSNVNTSSTANSATQFVFDTPIILNTNKEYCFVVMPQGMNPNYHIWVGELGGTDVLNSQKVYDTNFIGDLFTSSSQNQWVPYKREDIKFKMYCARYSSLTGSAIFVNSDTEFFTINNLKDEYVIGERVVLSHNSHGVYATDNVATSSTSNTISITNSGFDANAYFTVNTMLFVQKSDGTITDVKRIMNIANSSQMRLDSNLSFTDTDAVIDKLWANGFVDGYISHINFSEGKIYVNQSNAQGSNVFITGKTLIGITTGASANIASIDDIQYNAIVPLLKSLTPTRTSINWSMKGTSNTRTSDSSYMKIENNTDNEFIDTSRIVMSKSNEVTNSISKSIYLKAEFNSLNDLASPVIDDIASNALLLENIINANTTNEANSRNGYASSKYVSKRVVLMDGQDAEDLIVYITAYKPSGTDINVYCKLLNSEDSQDFEEKNWTLMEQETSSSINSNKINSNDFRDYKYIIPTAASSNVSATDYSAYLNSENSNIVRYRNSDGALFDTYKTFAIKIVMLSSVGPHLVPKIEDMRAIALQL